MRRLITTVLVAVLSISIGTYDLHGGEYPTKSKTIWQLYKYKYTTLLQTDPLCWCPYKSYVLVDRYVTVSDKYNLHWLNIEADLISKVQADADYNKAHAKVYDGTTKQKVRKIYNYCRRTTYKAHVKYARDVFEMRQGDCAGISSAFYVMCRKNKIPCRYVIGWTADSCHAWNRVYIKGRWYWIDATHELWLSRKQFPNRTVLEMW